MNLEEFYKHFNADPNCLHGEKCKCPPVSLEALFSLLSSQEQKHKKEMEELIEDIPNQFFKGSHSSHALPILKQTLVSKYLTKGKE